MYKDIALFISDAQQRYSAHAENISSANKKNHNYSGSRIYKTKPFANELHEAHVIYLRNGFLCAEKSSIDISKIHIYQTEHPKLLNQLNKLDFENKFNQKRNVLKGYAYATSYILIEIDAQLDRAVKLVYEISDSSNEAGINLVVFINITSHLNITLYEECRMRVEHCNFNKVTHLMLSQNSTCEHLVEQSNDLHDSYISYSNSVICKRNALYKNYQTAHNIRRYIYDIECILEQKYATCILFGDTLSVADESHTVNINVIHCDLYTVSSQLYHHVLFDCAIVEFYSDVMVRQLISNTEVSQFSHSLLLSDDAHMVTKPMLNISNNETKCAHGITVGYTNNDMLLYYKQRGVSEQCINSLIADAFLACAFKAFCAYV